MDIIVCIKRVAATDSKVRPGADGKSLDPQGVEFVLNPYDEYAVEEALKTREAKGGKVTVLCLGPGDAQKEIRTCLAMGADEGIHLKDQSTTRDAHSTATILANRIKTMKCDLLLFGRQAVDGDNSQVGQRVATLLGLGCVHEVTKLTLGEGRLTAERDIEGAKEVVECTLPAVITTQKGLNEPRYANLKGIMAAKKKPLVEETFADVPNGIVIDAMTPPPPRPPGRILGQGKDAVPALIAALKSEVKIF
jgi:electron transfer flavoprotein beta subunit